MMTQESRWATGTYELMIQYDTDCEPGDLLITVFAKPMDMDNEEADEDAPVLSQIELPKSEYGADLPAWQLGLREIGEDALLTPEVLEAAFGPRLALRILDALVDAARQDFNGLDMVDRPWRAPSAAAFPIFQRAALVQKELKGRFMS